GNIIGCVLSADVFARYQRSAGREILYICGTDEHGTTTEKKAREEGISPQEVCDKYYKIHKDVYEWFNIKFDHFGRTSLPNHTTHTQELFTALDKEGFVKQEIVKQLYSAESKTFLADRYVEGTCPHCDYEQARGDQCDGCGKLLNPLDLKNPRSAIDGSTPEIKESEHLFLDLPKLQDELQHWVGAQSELGAWTDNATRTTQGWFKEGLQPRAITRDLDWGISVPKEGFTDKVFYVWFDAPIGYISITEQLLGDDWKKWWQAPNEVLLYQFMAKDNIPFHTILFPGTLIGSRGPWTKLHHINST
ncbi:methionine--tRNA ligase, partial [Candidatus Woesearchaeota archaeon]|nr:methionine--tRNA ligase [Candidatus Woesearchaeota archaeon]